MSQVIVVLRIAYHAGWQHLQPTRAQSGNKAKRNLCILFPTTPSKTVRGRNWCWEGCDIRHTQGKCDRWIVVLEPEKEGVLGSTCQPLGHSWHQACGRFWKNRIEVMKTGHLYFLGWAILKPIKSVASSHLYNCSRKCVMCRLRDVLAGVLIDLLCADEVILILDQTCQVRDKNRAGVFN